MAVRRFGGRGGGGGRGAGAPAAAPGGEQAAGRGGAAAGAGTQAAGLGSRSSATSRRGEEVTIPEVTEYLWNQKGTWLAYAVSSNDAAKDGAFARRMSDGAVTTLHSGRGRYRSLVVRQRR